LGNVWAMRSEIERKAKSWKLIPDSFGEEASSIDFGVAISGIAVTKRGLQNGGSYKMSVLFDAIDPGQYCQTN